MTISFSALAALYFFRAQTVFENAEAPERFFNKLLPFGWSICVIGIMFLIQGWPGFDPMLVVGAFPQLVIILIILFLKKTKGVNYPTLDKAILIRSFILASISISLHFCSKEALLKHHVISEQHLK